MNLQRQQPTTPKPKKEEKCRIIIKMKKDGSIVKEVSGACTKQQLRVLQGNSSESDSEDMDY